jgi:hypothetical protein
MSLIKKCDVKSYFSTHPHTGRHPLRPVNKPGAKGFVEGCSMGPSSSGVSVTPIMISDNFDRVVVTAAASKPLA